MKTQLFSALILFCSFSSEVTHSQSRSIGLNAGPSISMPTVGSAIETKGVQPIWTWNVGIEILHKGKKHFEWGLGFNINNYVEDRRTYDYGYSEVQRNKYGIGAFRFMAGYHTAFDKNSISAGLSLGLCGASSNGGAALFGLTGGIYARYEYALSDRFNLSAMIQPSYYTMVGFWQDPVAIVSLPIGLGFAYKF